MIYLASDHAGFRLKKAIADYLKNKLKKDFVDLGPQEFEETDDYPDYAHKLAKKVAGSKSDQGILLCGSGNGVCMVANKTKGIRAILGYSIAAAEWGRAHEDANVMCLAGRVLTKDHASAIVKKFLETDFSKDERHARRVKKIED